ncbi:hypothetical protein [Croceibacterium selenioxidans]
MNKALQESAATQKVTAPKTAGQKPAGKKLDWRRKMSDHVAYALLAYTGLQIWVTMGALKSGHSSILPYFALIVLVAAIIPACRMFEQRWDGISDSEASNPELADRFKRDRLVLWLCALGLPFLLTGLFKVAYSLM